MEEEQVNPAPDQEPDKEEFSSMSRLLFPLFVIFILVMGAGAFFIGAQRRIQPSPIPTATVEATPTQEPTPTASPEATESPSPSPSPTPALSPTPTPLS